MKQYGKSEALCFDDVLLVPRNSEIRTRQEVDLTMTIGYANRISLYFPVISAPMNSVTGPRLAIELAKHGGLGIIPRESVQNNQNNNVLKVAEEGYPIGAAIPSHRSETFEKDVESLVFAGAQVLVVDTANGHNMYAVETVAKVRKAFPNVHIMAGNVSTWDGFLRLSLAGADSVRVGIGGGAACTTRIVTGHGIPTLASVMEIYEYQERLDLPTSIVADGGIRNSGDIVKSFAAGADAVMVGNLFAGHFESNRHGNLFGQASSVMQKELNNKVSVVEGTAGEVKFKGKLEDTIIQLRGGMQSGCSYSGVDKLEDLALVSEFVRVTGSSLAESNPHIV